MRGSRHGVRAGAGTESQSERDKSVRHESHSLYGGPSAEREVSLVSGRAVIDGLKSAGHEVFGSDVSPDDLSGLDHPADVIFPVLHGQFGESGELQEILEHRGLPFVGSGSAASRLGMNKVETKQAWERAGLADAGVVRRWTGLPTG